MNWFRMYHEIVDDPKVAMMSDTDQLLWIKALCLASESVVRGVILLEDETIAWRLRIAKETWLGAVEKFRAKGMLEHCDNGYKISQWDDRQFESDSSTERVRNYRNRRATAEEQDRNVSSNVSLSVLSSDLDLLSDSVLKQEENTGKNESVNSCLAMEQGMQARATRAEKPFQQAWDFYRDGCKFSGASPGPKTRAQQAWNKRFPDGISSPQFDDGLNAYWWVWRFEFSNGRNPSKPPNFSTYINNPESYEQMAIARQQLLQQAPQLASPKSVAAAVEEQSKAEAKAARIARMNAKLAREAS